MRELAFALEFEPGANRVADALAEHPGSRIRSLSLHVTAEQLWRVDHATGSPDALSAEQEAALRAAVEHGYYETPRTVDVSELADHLDVPRSTLTYRLRRAEAHLAERYVADEQFPEPAP